MTKPQESSSPRCRSRSPETARCTETSDCPALLHLHGCRRDIGDCDEPLEHHEAVAGAATALVEALLDQMPHDDGCAAGRACSCWQVAMRAELDPTAVSDLYATIKASALREAAGLLTYDGDDIVRFLTEQAYAAWLNHQADELMREESSWPA